LSELGLSSIPLIIVALLASVVLSIVFPKVFHSGVFLAVVITEVLSLVWPVTFLVVILLILEWIRSVAFRLAVVISEVLSGVRYVIGLSMVRSVVVLPWPIFVLVLCLVEALELVCRSHLWAVANNVWRSIVAQKATFVELHFLVKWHSWN
jgi:hypothetical protein